MLNTPSFMCARNYLFIYFYFFKILSHASFIIFFLMFKHFVVCITHVSFYLAEYSVIFPITTRSASCGAAHIVLSLIQWLLRTVSVAVKWLEHKVYY